MTAQSSNTPVRHTARGRGDILAKNTVTDIAVSSQIGWLILQDAWMTQLEA